MSDVNEEFARVFFEENDFLVRTNLDYYVKKDGSSIGGDSDIDLLILHLKPNTLNPVSNFVLNVEDLKSIDCAIVESKGWHTETFTESKINSNPRIFNFVREEAIKKAELFFNRSNFKKILLCSKLPTDQVARQKSIELLQSKGIDHIIEFSTIVQNLWKLSERKKSYDSEILQTIRLIKMYVNKT
jgi:hypothetical protein